VTTHSVIATIAAVGFGCIYAGHFAGASAPSQDPAGKAPYEENCRKCHGVRGVPPKTMKAKFLKIVTFDEEFFTKHSRDSIVTVLTKGKNADMKSFKAKLTHEQMEEVADYIKLFGQKEK
jgi:mono/diheme cytochrome c family protein